MSFESDDDRWRDELAENPYVNDLILALETYATLDLITHDSPPYGPDAYEESLASVGLDDGWVAYIAKRMRWKPS